MPKHVLILDDDPDLLSVMADIVAQVCGHQSITAADLTELQNKRLAALACDIAFLDVNLGAGKPSGVDAARWLRAQGFRGRMYFLTGHAHDHPLIREAASVESITILSKPIQVHRLTRLIQGIEE